MATILNKWNNMPLLFPKKYVHVVSLAILLTLRGLQLQNEELNRQLEMRNKIPEAPAAVDKLALAKAQRNKNYIRACMIVKDDNTQLAQWVAYHYTTLPLRRLIVGVDINSTEDPMDVLEKWNGSDLQFQVWYPEDYTQNISYGGDAKHRYLQRQHRLLARCLQYYHREGDLGWVALTDTDEYIKLNPMDDFLMNKIHNETSNEIDRDTIVDSLPHLTPNETMWDRIAARKRIRQQLGLDQPDTSNPSRKQQLHSAPTILEVLDEYDAQHGTLPCHAMSRRRYSAVVDNFTELAESLCVPKLDPKIMASMNISKLSTIQFLYHADPLLWKHNEWAKVLLDLRRLPYDSIAAIEEFRNPHKPLVECPRAYVPDVISLIHVNHYSTYWSEYVGRRGFNLVQTLDKEKEAWSAYSLVKDHVRCDQIHGWLNDFVDEFGLGKAKLLLGS